MDLNTYLPIIETLKKRQYSYLFTLFIPVFNGEKTIIRALESIENQTFIDFEVIIINDGSIDNTENIIKSYQKKSSLKITYLKNQENVHKLSTIFKGVKLAKGELFLIHDADDTCLPNALQIYANAYAAIPDNLKTKVSGVTANCVDQNGNFIGTNISEEYIYCNSFDFRFKYKIQGEKWGPTKTDILKQFTLNDAVLKNGFIPEDYLWNTIAKHGYVTKFLDKVTRIYYLSEENNLSSLKYENKAFGMGIYSLLFINGFYKKYQFKYPKPFLKRLISLVISSNYLNYGLNSYLLSIHSILLKSFFLILWPFRKIINNTLKM